MADDVGRGGVGNGDIAPLASAAGPSRRSVLGRGLVAAAGVVAPAAAGAAETVAPLEDPPWSRSLGAGIVDAPYGRPSEQEKDVVRRMVPWLTATRQSSISFSPLQHQTGIITPNGLFFERYHAGRPDVDSRSAPPPHPRDGGTAADPHDAGDRTLPFDVARPFHRMPGQRRHGMARGAVERAPVQPRHGELLRNGPA